MELANSPGGEGLWLIVGLGNPGSQYAQTRHNAGFMVLERLGQRRLVEWKKQERFRAQVARFSGAHGKGLLCQPQTYMNLSGEAVGALTAYYQIPHDRLLVVLDDADLPLGTLRMRPKGSSGGHHGLESIERHLGSSGFARLKVGIGRNEDVGRQITNHVLGRFQPEEKELLEKVIERAADQVECWLANGLQKAMNNFNGVIENPGTKDS